MFRLVRVAVILPALLAVLFLSGSVTAQKKEDTRYGVAYDPDNFPQGTAKQCLGSVIKAIDKRRIDYLMAQLADPQYVDMRVKQYGGEFRDVVQETTDKVASDPAVLKELRRFLSEGEWEDGDESASVKLKDVKSRAVFLKKIENRWYFENRQKAKEEGKDGK
jgi:hypothetical protein